jgi:hypothetical protein
MRRRDSDIAQGANACRRTDAALLVLLVMAVLLSGCAGGSDASHGDAASSQPARKTISFPIRHETHADIVASVEACREGVDLGTWLSRQSKADLYDSCNKGLKRGLTEVRQYGEQVCSEVAYTMPSTSQIEKKHVLDACEAKTLPFAPGVR